ncbi:putative vacuolar protein sorting 29 [Neospora caninum Liverpool]|uniref:Vacuolar protein sorting-associated protein 29 n=1 Tax=Neospora caninum (strain Liverpool) TaxID=572307 RepID=F0VFE5_NEOCL|nr:putative vacuolar protein sorting 29 [Neospora caninum Liverpool]CBZ52439.1 putative vacuolar protein sorting 29 [Neospora caninum Liverpool]CEL66413.1 TPA: vacuolar protein sorting 29, putative [Neospora caninum Liverpool]|eukprot:XP_003882471.1 putative vacuolar protein sorting 29 [Neospora caninum Liverpool]
MGANFTEFGDLVLLIGDFHIPQRAIDLPPCFRELLNTDKIRHVLCTGNVGCASVVDSLRSISSSLHIVKGDADAGFDFPEYKVLQFGQFKVGLIHGHQIVPYGDGGSLLHWQRKLDCDILVYGHLHKDSVVELEGKFFVNPGSATGAYQPWLTEKVPSFMLMAVQGSSVVLYVYEEKNGKAEVVMSEFKKDISEAETTSPTER